MEGIDDTESGEEGGEGEGHEEEEEDDMPGLPHPEVESRTAPQDPSLPAAQTIVSTSDPLEWTIRGGATSTIKVM